MDEHIEKYQAYFSGNVGGRGVGVVHILFIMKYFSSSFIQSEHAWLIMGTMMLISVQFTFGLNLLFVFGSENITQKDEGSVGRGRLNKMNHP